MWIEGKCIAPWRTWFSEVVTLVLALVRRFGRCGIPLIRTKARQIAKDQSATPASGNTAAFCRGFGVPDAFVYCLLSGEQRLPAATSRISVTPRSALNQSRALRHRLQGGNHRQLRGPGGILQRGIRLVITDFEAPPSPLDWHLDGHAAGFYVGLHPAEPDIDGVDVGMQFAYAYGETAPTDRRGNRQLGAGGIRECNDPAE